jgi:hypothetical protein
MNVQLNITKSAIHLLSSAGLVLTGVNFAAAQQEVGLLSMRSYFGPIVSAQNGGGAYTVATSLDVKGSESFRIFDFTSSQLSSGDEIALQSWSSNLYLSCRIDKAGTPLMVTGGGPWAWERFRIYKSSGSGSIRTGDEFFLVGVNGKIVTTRFDENNYPLAVRANAAGTWEKFRAQVIPKGFVLKDWCNGARTYLRGSGVSTEYVTVVDLTRARLESTYNRFSTVAKLRENVSQLGTTYSISNGTFFGGTWKPLYGLKIRGQVIEPIERDYANTRALCFGGTSANIRRSVVDAINDRGTTDVVGLLSEATPNKESEWIGRNLVGLADAFGEGRMQHLYLYSTSSQTNPNARTTIRSFGVVDVGQLDGSGSVWTRVWGSDYILPGRPLSHVLSVHPAL